ncbi:MAG: cobalt ECF transporter T component CbiQ [Methanobrevibacter sp.]|uniref:cobalt ECF transporter T component CbiQ n=1 Tax=Methanobrevibacter sp. TaxID=66852 RepID=UPI0025FDD382|nr:cobalt ECF transporter T component CbiQ [Methanobrevibacter sp.]MBQ6099173.1 cobalt ECF transporter T component CbiQ [Methanobrevibacter sp.]
MKFDIDYIAHNNRLSDFNLYVKVIVAIGLMVATLILDNLTLDIAVFVLMAILVLGVARISLKSYIKFLTIPIVFAVITCLFLLFFFGHGELIYDTGLWGIGITQSSLDLAVKTFCRCFACFSCLGFLTLTTPIADILQCLHMIKVPVIFIDIALLMYNTIFIFLDQLNTMRNAQETRLGYMGSKSTYKSLGMLFSNLFFRSLDKSETLQCSLDSRCYQGYLPVYKPNRRK